MTNDDKRPGATESFDVIVIGGGPAGYPAAIRAAQNKLRVACIDEWKNRDGSATFGGTCLNAGCIPSKALLESTELYHRVHEEFAVHGIKVAGAQLDLAQIHIAIQCQLGALMAAVQGPPQRRRNHNGDYDGEQYSESRDLWHAVTYLRCS